MFCLPYLSGLGNFTADAVVSDSVFGQLPLAML